VGNRERGHSLVTITRSGGNASVTKKPPENRLFQTQFIKHVDEVAMFAFCAADFLVFFCHRGIATTAYNQTVYSIEDCYQYSRV